MTKAEYDKKLAELKEAGFEAYKAWGELDQASREADKVCDRADWASREACKVLVNAYKAIDDLKESWAKQESEAGR